MTSSAEIDAAWIEVADAVECLCDCDAYCGNDPEWHDPACPTTRLREALTRVTSPGGFDA